MGVPQGAVFGVLGAGSFGTALAIHLARRDHATALWGRNAAAMADMQAARENAAYLPGCAFPLKLTVTADLADVVAHSSDLLVATPSHALRAMLEQVRPLLRPGQGVACACKGFEPGSGRLIHEVIEDVLGTEVPLAVISGPTFAKELGIGLPTSVTVASRHPVFADSLAKTLHGDGFRAYTADDLIGVEIGGAVKNVMAIAVGMADGLSLGANTRAALITRGLAEIMRLGEALGADRDTLMGLSGMGDLVLTCTDNQSRNRRLGLMLAKGLSVTEAIAEVKQVVEGIKAAPEALRLAELHGVEMPITTTINRILNGSITPLEGVRELATRPQRPENE